MDILRAVYGKPLARFSQASSNRGTELTVSKRPRKRILRTGLAKVSRKAFM